MHTVSLRARRSLGRLAWLALLAVGCLAGFEPFRASAQVLDQRAILDRQTFWDNRDWDWYREQIPFFECPDEQLNTTYYYRWELLTKHLTYGSPDTGYVFTEFIDRPFWSGAYGAISCPAGHQLYEARWLRDPRIAREYVEYWLRHPGAQPRNYSTWLADSAWAVQQVHPDDTRLRSWLPGLVKNHDGWAARHFDRPVGLYWQTGHDDGMEFNINSRQTRDILRGAPSYRPSFNAYMWADAMALAKIAEKAGNATNARDFRRQADEIKQKLQTRLWDEKREFFFPMFRQDEEREGHVSKALTLTYQTGAYAGNPHGRELIGYVPWQFKLPDAGRGFEAAWKFLMDTEYFADEFGPTTVERRDPQFLLQKSCCWWSGQSWPYATTQTLKALANVLQHYEQSHVTRADYLRLLQTYSRSHRKDGRPYLAEALHPTTGSFAGHDAYNHSEHYFHSGFCDLVITGLVGLDPQDDGSLAVRSLAPESWDYFALERVRYRTHEVAVYWDRTGKRYGLGSGLRVTVDGQVVAKQEGLASLVLPAKLFEGQLGAYGPNGSVPGDATREAAKTIASQARGRRFINYAVNNDGHYFPRITATFTAPQTSAMKLIDGNYWYHQQPPNRWTSVGSTRDFEEIEIDLGTPRPIELVALYLLDDRENADGNRDDKVTAPSKIEVELGDDRGWRAMGLGRWHPESPVGHRPNFYSHNDSLIKASKVRVRLYHGAGKAGLSEIELWGPGESPIAPAPPPAGNLAHRPKGAEFPKASASHTSRYDKVESANDGVTIFAASPNNRWTSYESPNATDWLEIDFGKQVSFGRVELALYDDRGGVQAPRSYSIEYWDGTRFIPVQETSRQPTEPAGGQWNQVRFTPVKSQRARVVFTHRGPARSGVSEVMIFP